MVLGPLATVDDLTALGVDTTDSALIQSLLDSVSAEVREAAGVPITRTTSTVTVAGNRGQILYLPGGPVRTVSIVILDGTEIDDFVLREGRLWRLVGWGSDAVDVTVTYEHGYDQVPADVVRLVCMFVSAGVHAAQQGGAASHRGIAYERGDDYQIGYMQGDAEVVDPSELPDRTRRMLRQRFSGEGAHVLGGY